MRHFNFDTKKIAALCAAIPAMIASFHFLEPQQAASVAAVLGIALTGLNSPTQEPK